MSDTIQLVPSVPVVARPAPVRPDQQVEPSRQSNADNKTAGHGAGQGNDSDQHAEQPSRHLTISRQDNTSAFVYRSIDGDSGDVLWQYPADSLLRMSQHLQELEKQKAQHEVDQRA